MRKVFVEVKVRVVLNVDEGEEVSNIIDEMTPRFTAHSDYADIEDVEILSHEVTDSK